MEGKAGRREVSVSGGGRGLMDVGSGRQGEREWEVPL